MAETEGQNIPASKTQVGSGFLLLFSFPAPTCFHDDRPSVTADFIFESVLPLTTANAEGRLEEDSLAVKVTLKSLHSPLQMQHCPTETSVMLELLSSCSVHYRSHQPHATFVILECG